MVQHKALKLWVLELLSCPESLHTGYGQSAGWLAVFSRGGRELGKGEYRGPSDNFTPALLNRASVLCKKRGRSVVTGLLKVYIIFSILL